MRGITGFIICSDTTTVVGRVRRTGDSLRPCRELRPNRGLYDLARCAKYLASFTHGPLRGRDALLDYPFAFFSTALFSTAGCRCVVSSAIRAFVGSCTGGLDRSRSPAPQQRCSCGYPRVPETHAKPDGPPVVARRPLVVGESRRRRGSPRFLCPRHVVEYLALSRLARSPRCTTRQLPLSPRRRGPCVPQQSRTDRHGLSRRCARLSRSLRAMASRSGAASASSGPPERYASRADAQVAVGMGYPDGGVLARRAS